MTVSRCFQVPSRSPRGGFTRLDLLAVGASLVLLAGLLLPALAGAARGGHAAVCLNNLRQMARASLMYTADNHDKFPGAFHGGKASAPTKNATEGACAVGWLTWDTSSHNTNTLFLTDPGYSSLAWYLNGDRLPFKCPADRYVSDAQARKGWAERVRSISVNLYIGKGNAEEGPIDAAYKHVFKPSDIVYPSPAESWLFLDEHPDSINDPGCFSPLKAAWLDLPASYHEGACSVVFVDGRAELHQWRGSTIRDCAYSSTFMGSLVFPTSQKDIDWLRYRTPRVREAY
jgi:hypothetical protein